MKAKSLALRQPKQYNLKNLMSQIKFLWGGEKGLKSMGRTLHIISYFILKKQIFLMWMGTDSSTKTNKYLVQGEVMSILCGLLSRM